MLFLETENSMRSSKSYLLVPSFLMDSIAVRGALVRLAARQREVFGTVYFASRWTTRASVCRLLSHRPYLLLARSLLDLFLKDEKCMKIVVSKRLLDVSKSPSCVAMVLRIAKNPSIPSSTPPTSNCRKP
jgi:hypothetical protein